MSEKITSDKILQCPRDNALMQATDVSGTHIDRCGRCHGTFFDTGEMFGALGTTADPSYWDRPGVAGSVRHGKLACPRCKGEMLLQDVSDATTKVEIDRCGHCGGIWLDPGEEQKIMSIGARQVEAVLAERRAAQADLDKLGDVDFRPPGMIFRFLSLFKSK
jgi:Zn-finger nucleic acid-binding protein